MFSCECVLAAVLLTSPTEMPLAPHQAAWVESVRPVVLTLAIDAQILDPREKGFVLSSDMIADLTMLQGRYRDLASAPYLEEGQRFPDRKLINDLLAMNRAFRNQLSSRLSVDLVHAEELRSAIIQTDQLYQVWDTVRDGRCDYYYVTVRRQAFALLRDLVGPESFYNGQLPPHLPVWLFPRN